MLTNADNFEIRKTNTIIVDTDSFDDIISKVTNGEITVDYDEWDSDMLLVDSDGNLAEFDEIVEHLSKYFNVTVTDYEFVKHGESEPSIYVYYTTNANTVISNLVGYLAELKERDDIDEWNYFWKEYIGMSDEDMKYYNLIREKSED